MSVHEFVKAYSLQRLHRPSRIVRIDDDHVEEVLCRVEKGEPVGKDDLGAVIFKTLREIRVMFGDGVLDKTVYFDDGGRLDGGVFHEFPQAAAVAAADDADSRGVLVHHHRGMDDGFMIDEFVTLGKHDDVGQAQDLAETVGVEDLDFLERRRAAEQRALGAYRGAERPLTRLLIHSEEQLLEVIVEGLSIGTSFIHKFYTIPKNSPCGIAGARMSI